MTSDTSDSFTLGSGIAPRLETSCSKRLNRESHPCAAAPSSVNLLGGGKMRGKDDAEWLGGGPLACQVSRRGR